VDLAIREALPNVSTVQWPSAGSSGDPATRTVAEGGSVRERVLDYLTRNVPNDAQREPLVALAVGFLDRVCHR
jgi:hypothetical protein